MQIENLNSSDVDFLEKQLEHLRQGNPDITHKVFNMDELSTEKKLDVLIEKVEALDRKIDLIFGGHVLIKGAWADHEAKHRKAMKKGGFNHIR